MGTRLFGEVSISCSRSITQRYSTSFTLGIRCLKKQFHDPIYAVYGFVRVADEIVDSFTNKDREALLDRFEADTYRAIEDGISSNPVLEAFQRVVHQYNIEIWTIDRFLKSMRMDLHRKDHDRESFSDYVLGSAESVGLMCLRIFAEGDGSLYNSLEAHARSLGKAFQEVNFLRDLQEDQEVLGRNYFPHQEGERLDRARKEAIEQEIEKDLEHAYKGIVKLPKGSRFGVYVAYVYYRELFRRIQRSSPEVLEQERIRIPNLQKGSLLLTSYLRYRTLSI